MESYIELFNAKRSRKDGTLVSLEEIGNVLGIDRKTVRLRLREPSTFRGYELRALYKFLSFTPDEQIFFNQEVTK